MPRFVSIVATGLVASFVLAGCGPSAEDEKKMNDKMELENKRSQILLEDKSDCPKLGKELADFKASKDGKRLAELAPWWSGLGSRAKDKLIEEHKAEWDKQTGAIGIGGMSCVAEFKQNF